MPISYYEQTTPYPLDNLDEDAFNDFVDPDDFGEGIDFDGDQGSTSDFNQGIVQAFNPFVKVFKYAVFKIFLNLKE